MKEDLDSYILNYDSLPEEEEEEEEGPSFFNLEEIKQQEKELFTKGLDEATSSTNLPTTSTSTNTFTTSTQSLIHRLSGPSSEKAGVDKNFQVNQRIYELSKGSKFYANELKKDLKVTQRVEVILNKYEQLKKNGVTYLKVEVDKLKDKFIKEFDSLEQRVVTHVDMDAFYASVEELDDQSLKGKPMAVGGDAMLSTANYEARKFGVRSAMPGFIAKQLCPELVIVPCRFSRYKEISDQVHQVFEVYDPEFRSISLDEAYLDITEYCHSNQKSPSQVVSELRQAIFDKTGLTASAGIGPNRLISKIGSDFNKPNGQFLVGSRLEELRQFMAPLSIRKIPGIGRVTERVLNAVGVKTCQDMLDDAAMLYGLLSEKSFQYLFPSCLGLQPHRSSENSNQTSQRQSISSERTFTPTEDPDILINKVNELAPKLAELVQHKQFKAKTVTLKLKTDKFEIKTRSITLNQPTDQPQVIQDKAQQLLAKELPIKVRLMGIRLSNLVPNSTNQGTFLTQFFKPKAKGNETSPIQVNEEVGVNEADEDISLEQGEKEVHLDTTTVLYPPTKSFQCPICSKAFLNKFDDLKFINGHVDSCLNQPLLNSNLDSHFNLDSGVQVRDNCGEIQSGSRNGKQKLDGNRKSNKQIKKKKGNDKDKEKENNKKKGQMTLDHFFKK